MKEITGMGVFLLGFSILIFGSIHYAKHGGTGLIYTYLASIFVMSIGACIAKSNPLL